MTDGNACKPLPHADTVQMNKHPMNKHCTLCSPSLFLYKSTGFLPFLSNNPTLASGIYTTQKKVSEFR